MARKREVKRDASSASPGRSGSAGGRQRSKTRESASTAAPRSEESSSSPARASSPRRRSGNFSGGGGDSRSRRASRSSSRHRTPAPRRPPPAKFARRRTSAEVWRCKKGKRSEIQPGEWDKAGYALNEEVLTRPIVYDQQTVPIPRVSRKDITPEEFLEKFRKQNRPVIIEDAMTHWPAMQRWSIDGLEERFRHVAFKVAKDDKGKKLRMKFKYYADYLRNQKDDNPLYLFETNMDDNSYIRPLMNDYEVPDLFDDDFFNLVNHDSRPPYRWFCIGPRRSGTTVHIDPLGTAAWNAVTHGSKHWVLFEPQEAKRTVKGKDVIRKGEDDDAIMYYDYILPRMKKAHPEVRFYEGIQKPGEIIFVPGNWWHAVLNKEDCVAVTQNYCGIDNFDMVWSLTRKEREKVAALWLRNMKRFAPQLHERAVSLNRRDGFKMRKDRAPGEKLSSDSSSGSSSSSDSSSDEAVDLDPFGLQRAVRDANTRLGAGAFRLQGTMPDGANAAALIPRADTCGERDGNGDRTVLFKRRSRSRSRSKDRRRSRRSDSRRRSSGC